MSTLIPMFAVGVFLMMGGILFLPAEWLRTGRMHNPSFQLVMTQQMRVINAIRLTIVVACFVLLGGMFAGWISAPLRMIPVPIILLLMGITYVMGLWLLPERKAANFTPHTAKSFFVFLAGGVLSIVGLILAA